MDDTALSLMAEEVDMPSAKQLREAVQQAGAIAPAKPMRPELERVEGEVALCWQLRRRWSVLQRLLGSGFVFDLFFGCFKVPLASP